MKKNGFMATSLIYSFFLVFLMLMALIISKNVSNRILLSSLKNEIRSELNEDEAFVVDTLKKGTYAVGDMVSYAGEDWQVITNKTTSLILVLKRALKMDEIRSTLSYLPTDTSYFGTCDVNNCRVRSCRSVKSFDPQNPPEGIYGRENCYYDPQNPTQYLKPAWKPNANQVQTQDYGERIISTVVTNWFHTHQGLQRALELNQLNALQFNDGYLNYTESNQIYVRIPLQSEVTSANSNKWNTINRPFHILNNPNAVGANQIMIYNTSVQTVLSNTDAFIRPVIEVKLT